MPTDRVRRRPAAGPQAPRRAGPDVRRGARLPARRRPGAAPAVQGRARARRDPPAAPWASRRTVHPAGLRAAVPDPRRADPGQEPAARRRARGSRCARPRWTAGSTSTSTRSPTGARCTRRWPRSCELGVLQRARRRPGALGRAAHRRPCSTSAATGSALLVAAPLSASLDPDELLDVAALPSAAGGARVADAAPSGRVAGAVDGRADRRAGRVVAARAATASASGSATGSASTGAARRGRAWPSTRTGELTDVEFPGAGAARQLALLVLEASPTSCRPAPAPRPASGRSGPSRAHRSGAGRAVDADGSTPGGASGHGLHRDQREDPAAAVAESLRRARRRRAGPTGTDGRGVAASTPPRAGTAACAQLAEAPGTGAPSLFDPRGRHR